MRGPRRGKNTPSHVVGGDEAAKKDTRKMLSLDFIDALAIQFGNPSRLTLHPGSGRGTRVDHVDECHRAPLA